MKESWDVSIQHSAPKLCLDRKKKKEERKSTHLKYSTLVFCFFFSSPNMQYTEGTITFQNFYSYIFLIILQH